MCRMCVIVEVMYVHMHMHAHRGGQCTEVCMWPEAAPAESTLRWLTGTRTWCPVIDDDGPSALPRSGVTHLHTHTHNATPPPPSWMDLVWRRPTQLLPAWIAAQACVSHLITASVLMNALSFSVSTHWAQTPRPAPAQQNLSMHSKRASVDLMDGFCFTALVYSPCRTH